MFVARRYRSLLEAAKRDRNEKRFWRDLPEMIAAHSASEFSIRQLFEAFVDDGREMLDIWAFESRGYGNETSFADLLEAGVTTTAFARITEKIFGDVVLDVWNEPEYIGDQLVDTQSTRYLDGEKMAGISLVGEQLEAIGEGMPYPLAGVTEEYVESPRTSKYGNIVPVTKEALIADRTGELIRRCQTNARGLRQNKEKRILDVVLGISNTYRRNGGNAQNTYGTTHTEGDFSNLVTGNAMGNDFACVEASDNAFEALTDPNTGDPISVMPTAVIVVNEKKNLAHRIFNATEFRDVTGSRTMIYSNPLNMPRPDGMKNNETVFANKYIKSRLSGTTTTWFRGNFPMAFGYAQVWPIMTTRAPRNSNLEFHNDIVEQFKVSERGVPYVKEPRYVQKNTA